MYLPFSKMNSASLKSSRQFLKASISSEKSSATMLMSTFSGVVLYCLRRPADTNCLVPVTRCTNFDTPCMWPWLISFLNGSSAST